MSDQPPIMPGSVLVSCTLSCVVGGIVQTNIGDRERMWRLDDPDKLREHLGRGLLARMPAGPDRYRESGLIDEKQGLLILPARFPDKDGLVGAVDIVTLTPLNGNAVAAFDEAKVEIAMAVRQSIPVMLHDGGAVILEPTKPETGGPRWVRVFRRESQLAVWTSPQPDSEMWRPAFVGDTEARAVMPLGDSAIHDAAVLAANAFAAWELSPWDVSLTFLPYQETHDAASPMREERTSLRGLFGRRRRPGREKVETAPRPAVNAVSQARSSIAAVQGHMRVEPLGGAHWTEARIGLGPWAARILLDSEAGEFRCEAQIPGVTDTSGVDEAVGAAPFEAPRAMYLLSPGPTVVTLCYSRPLAGVNPAVVREMAMMLVTAISAAAFRLWDVLSPMELARLAQLGISTPDGLYSTPDEMLMAKPIANVDWDQRVAPVDSAPPAEARLPQGLAGVIPGPLGPEWASTIAEIREVLDQFISTMNIEVQRRDRDDEIYIQLSHEGDHFFAEAVSNTFLEGASRLNSTDMQRLSHLGWHPPTGDDDPNWSRRYGGGNTGDVAEHLAKTLRDAYGADPEADGWLIKWSDPASEPADPARVIPIAPLAITPPPAKKIARRPSPGKKAASRQQKPQPAASLAPEISNALQHLRNSLGTAFQTRERPTGGYDLVTENGQTYGVAGPDFIRVAVNSSALLRYGRGWGTKSVNRETGKQEWTVRADEFDLDRGDLGRLVGIVEGAKRWPELDAPQRKPEAGGKAEPRPESTPLNTQSVGVDELAAMLRAAVQDGSGTHLDVGPGFVRWQGDPKQGLLVEAGNGQPGTPIDKPLADSLVSIGWSRPRPRDGVANCWVELILGADEPEHRLAARLEAVAEVVLGGIRTLSDSKGR